MPEDDYIRSTLGEIKGILMALVQTVASHAPKIEDLERRATEVERKVDEIREFNLPTRVRDLEASTKTTTLQQARHGAIGGVAFGLICATAGSIVYLIAYHT